MNTPTFCRSTGKRIGTCDCLRCNPPPPKEPTDASAL